MPWYSAPVQRSGQPSDPSSRWVTPHTSKDRVANAPMVAYNLDTQAVAVGAMGMQHLVVADTHWFVGPEEAALWQQASKGNPRDWVRRLDAPHLEPLLLRVHREAPPFLAERLIDAMSDGGARWDAVGTDGVPVWKALERRTALAETTQVRRLAAAMQAATGTTPRTPRKRERL